MPIDDLFTEDFGMDSIKSLSFAQTEQPIGNGEIEPERLVRNFPKVGNFAFKLFDSSRPCLKVFITDIKILSTSFFAN